MTEVPTKGLITPEAILSYPHLFTPQPGMNGGPAKFSASFIFVEGSDLDALKRAAVAVAKDKWGDKAVDMIRGGKLRMPFRTDWEDKGYPENSTFIGARSKNAPGLVAWDGETIITDEKEFYPGVIVRAQISAFAYDTNGNKGVSFGLDNIQKVREGERLDGRISAKNAFDAVEPPAALDFGDVEGPTDAEATVDELAGLGL